MTIMKSPMLSLNTKAAIIEFIAFGKAINADQIVWPHFFWRQWQRNWFLVMISYICFSLIANMVSIDHFTLLSAHYFPNKNWHISDDANSAWIDFKTSHSTQESYQIGNHRYRRKIDIQNRQEQTKQTIVSNIGL